MVEDGRKGPKLKFIIMFSRFKKFKIENYGIDTLIGAPKSPKRMDISPANECCSMAVRSLMQSSRKVLTNGMRTLAACLVLAFISPSTVQRAINTFTGLAAALDVQHTRINLVIPVPGSVLFIIKLGLLN